jgi:hypothetical protein
MVGLFWASGLRGIRHTHLGAGTLHMLAGRLGGNCAMAELAVVMMVGPSVRTGRGGAITAVTIVVTAVVVVIGDNVVPRPLGRAGRKRAA